MQNKKSFTFYFSEEKLTDTDVRDLIKVLEGDQASVMVYKLPYVPPFENDPKFIKKFQYRSAYKPFCDETCKKKIVAVNLTDWLGHEDEENLEVFTKFIHDYHSFFDYQYFFMAEKTNEKEIKGLYFLMSEYMGRGQIIENKWKDGKDELH